LPGEPAAFPGDVPAIRFQNRDKSRTPSPNPSRADRPFVSKLPELGGGLSSGAENQVSDLSFVATSTISFFFPSFCLYDQSHMD
jgi:hypothetical protein